MTRPDGETVGSGAGASDDAGAGECPFLDVQRSGLRRLTPWGDGKIEVRERYLCQHPFHGLPLPLGESRAEAASTCATCRLPRDPQPDRRSS